ncbi:MAG: hypothetical protein ACOYPR_07855 [Saprospiraceae bacterium]
MLNRIVVINSALYAKANLHLGDAESIQLAAENNVGKSSLINCLNFLYILDKREWKFGDNTASETIKHYFKTVDQSYVVFEIVKDGYYCIVVKRAIEKEDLDYCIIQHAYEDEMFFKREGDTVEPLKFKDVVGNLTRRGIPVKPKVSRDDLYQRIYSQQRRDKPVVITTDKVKRAGNSRSNSFTKMYKHLIKADAINEEAFKDALLIADNRKEASLDVFTDRSLTMLQEFDVKRKKIALLESVVADFNNFKLLNNEFNIYRERCSALKVNFLGNYKIAYPALREEIRDDGLLAIQIRTLQTEIDDTLKVGMNRLVAEKTRLEVARENQEKEAGGFQKELEDTFFYRKGQLGYSELESEIQRLKSELGNLTTILTQISRPNVTELSVQGKIKNLGQEMEQLNSKIARFDHLAQHHLAADPDLRRKLSAYLHRDVLSLDKSHIQRTVTQADAMLTVFDGAIDVSSLPPASLETLEDLKARLPQAKAELEEQENLLEAIAKQQQKEQEKRLIEGQLKEQEAFFDKVRQRPTTERLLRETQEQIEELTKKITDKSEEIFKKENEMAAKRSEKERLDKDLVEKRQLLKNYASWYSELQHRTDVPKMDGALADDRPLQALFNDFQKGYNEMANLRGKRDEEFNRLLRKLSKDSNDINTFVSEVQEEMDTLPDQQKALDGLFELAFDSFVNPVKAFRLEYQNFKAYVQKFSQSLSKYPVSNIRKISIHTRDNTELLRELDLIYNVERDSLWRASAASEEGIQMMRKKFDENRAIHFEQMFDLELEIEMDGDRKKTVRLDKQVESQGTDAVLKLFLFLSVIRQLADSGPNNKIAIYFDELGRIGPKNISQVIQFCRDNNFIPIFAAPTDIEGIEKYYTIKPSTRHKQGIVLDERHVKIARYKNA